MKIGILTHYYKSTNYGGNLQAYALVRFLRENGFEAEQVCYQRFNDYLFGINPVSDNGLTEKAKRAVNLVRKYSIHKRERSVLRFNQNVIPHSSAVYSKDTLMEIGRNYDALITGSDQVWHPMAVCDAYLLNFPTTAKKISYAASFAVEDVDDRVAEYYRSCLECFDAISVRERKGQELIRKICGRESELVLDPTLLLSRAAWETIIEERAVQEPYLFCYFLDNDPDRRDLAERLARSKGLEIVSMPYLSGKNRADKHIGKYRFFDVSPGQLLYLIQHANMVLTDSFHITVFSILFEKEFFSLDRGRMGSRIQTLTDYFGLVNRFCNSPEKKTIEYMNKISRSDRYTLSARFEDLKNQSKEYLITNLTR